MTQPEAKPHYEDVSTSTIALAGLIGSIIVLALVGLLMVVYYRVDAQQQRAKVESEQPEEWTKLRTDQEGRLAEYAWLDQKAGTVVIPIERAKALVIEEVKASGEAKRIRQAKLPAEKKPEAADAPAAEKKPDEATPPPGDVPSTPPAENKPDNAQPEAKKPDTSDPGPA